MDIQLTPLFDAATSGRFVTQYTQELLGATIEHLYRCSVMFAHAEQQQQYLYFNMHIYNNKTICN